MGWGGVDKGIHRPGCELQVLVACAHMHARGVGGGQHSLPHLDSSKQTIAESFRSTRASQEEEGKVEARSTLGKRVCAHAGVGVGG